MFENSLISRLPIRCPEHPKNTLTHFCTDPRCDVWPLFCEECKTTYRYKEKHYGHELSVMQLRQGIQQLCNRMERDKKLVNGIYKEMISVKGVEGLLKWQEQKQQHFTAIQKHINTIKYQIQEEITNIIRKFQDQLEIEKNRLYTELEHYYNNYKDKFDKFSRLTEPIVAMNNKFKFYACPNTIIFKISNQVGLPKLGVWLSELKRAISLTEKATASPVQYVQQIRKYGQTANDIMDELPRIKNMEYEKEMPLIVTSVVKEILKAFVKLKQARASQVMRSTSLDSIPIDHNKWKHSVSYK